MPYVYFLRCADNSLYCGYTVDLKHRVAQHQLGRGAKYTRARLPVSLVYAEEFEGGAFMPYASDDKEE